MLEGCYEITLKSPLGLKKGSISVIANEDGIRGTIDILNDTNQFAGRVLPDNKFEAYGELKTPTGQVPYNVEGMVEENGFHALMNTTKGLMELRGKRIG